MWTALIADDERRIRTTIRKLGNWDELGIEILSEAENGDDLLQLAEHEKPDIIITDMHMPGLSGAALTRRLCEAFPSSQVIIISGYDDFEYTKQAIVSKANDYILKPIDKDLLHDSLRKAVKELESSRNKKQHELSIQMKLNETLPLLNENMMNQYLFGTENNRQELLECLGISETEGVLCHDFIASVVKIENFQVISSAKYQSDTPLFYFALINMIDEVIHGKGKAFRSNQQENELILLFYGTHEQPGIGEAIEQIAQRLQHYLSVRLFVGIGSVVNQPEEIKFSLNEARTVLLQLNLLGESRIGFYADFKQHPYIEPAPLFPHDRFLEAAVENSSLSAVTLWAEQYYTELAKSAYLNLKQLKKINVDVLLLLEKMVQHADAKAQLLGELLLLREQIGNEADLIYIPQRINSFIAAIADFLTKRKERTAIHDIKAHIEQQFASKLSLQDLASQFYLTKEYISKCFKDEFGINLFEYIMQLKINRAKELLLNPDMKVREIIDIVGFNDESHFSKSFKKQTGQSPKAFRSLHE